MRYRSLLLAVLMLLIGPIFAQSGYMVPEEGYLTNDHFVAYTFSAFDVHGDLLFGYDEQGLHALSLTTGEELYVIPPPPNYLCFSSFLSIDETGQYAWMGFTVTGNDDDRIYTCNLSTQQWEQQAVFACNFDMERRGDHILISGLNAVPGAAPNGIYILDTSGNNDHIKLIETGGSSAGLAVDSEGNIYYASFFYDQDMILKWDSADIEEVITGGSAPLTPEEAETISLLPAGSYDIDCDNADNIIFNCNDYVNGSFVGVWDGTTGNGEHFFKTATTTEFLTMLSVNDNVNAGNTFYCIGFSTPVASIQREVPITVVDPIADRVIPKNGSIEPIDLQPVFAPQEGVSYQVAQNSNPSLINTTIEGHTLHLETGEAMTGEAVITIGATLDQFTVTTSFTVTVFDYDYSEGIFIVNEDWFGHDNGSVNFLTHDGNFVYRAYRHENPGETLGVTTQFGTTWAGHIIFMSKQGNRFVVVDEETLELEAKFEDLTGDGRSCAGVDETHLYVGHSNGIRIFNLETMQFEGDVSGISGETYNMVAAEGYLFVIQDEGIRIIKDHTVIESITGYPGISGLTRAKDGDLYAGGGNTLLRISPYTLEHELIELPAGVTIAATNSVWNSGSLCASTQKNVLYWNEDGGWNGSSLIFRYEIGNMASLEAPIAQLPEGWVTYGAGIRVHPTTNAIYLTAKMAGWGSNSSYNRVYLFDGETGQQKEMYEMEPPYYWFPAMPLMPDAFAPQVICNIEEVVVEMNAEPIQLNLSQYVVDLDNILEGFVYEVTSIAGDPIIETTITNNTLEIAFVEESHGTCEITVKAVSNGKTTEMAIPVTVKNNVGMAQASPPQIRLFPNPVTSGLHITSGQDPIKAIEIRNGNGTLVEQRYPNHRHETVDMRQLPNGYYFITIHTKEKKEIHHIIKQ
ncbi:MAG: hypothetical protein CSA04_02695 [Bacteroidetes bacterium]|nr:MAG: hypothetical protein CSA04_02695 [Bacteroidota bacterium]